MTQYIGLDVSMKETKLHVLDDTRKRVSSAMAARLIAHVPIEPYATGSRSSFDHR